jgi:hypothetical protein
MQAGLKDMTTLQRDLKQLHNGGGDDSNHDG